MKSTLLAPGPSMTPHFVWKKMEKNQGIAHHRHPGYIRIDKEVRGDLLNLFRALDGTVLLFCGGGRSIMEAVVANFCSPRTATCVVNTGKFGDEWAAIARKYSVPAYEVKSEWGYTFDRDALTAHLKRYLPHILFMQASDTSTGVINNWKAVRALIDTWSPHTLLALDAVLEGGVSKINMDEDGVDIVVGAGQKAFMLPVALDYAVLGTRALARLSKTGLGLPVSTFDFRDEIDARLAGRTRFTPANQAVIGLHAVLRYLYAVGETQWYQDHLTRAHCVRNNLKNLDLELFTKDTPTNAVSVFSLPPGVVASVLQERLREAGFWIDTGQGHLKNSTFRISHFAGVDIKDILRFCETFKPIYLSLRQGN